MSSILAFIRNSVFEPHDITAMSMALDDVCKTLNVQNGRARELIAGRIVSLARAGERSPTRLRDHILRESGFSTFG